MKKFIMGVVMLVFLLVCGIVGGYTMGKVQRNYMQEGTMGWQAGMFAIVILFVLFLFACFLQIYIHETGHMVCGLMSGYRFRSIRFGSLMFVKTENGLKLKHFSLAGTGGQCLMIPPEIEGDYYPTTLYNMGGCLANLIVSLVCMVAYLVLDKASVLALVFLFVSLIGIGFALLNGMPVSSLSNDGYNTQILRKDAEARTAFWIQLNINNSLSQGKSIAEMPKEWFEWEEKVPENNLTAAAGYMRFGYLIECKRFEEARHLGEFLLENSASLANIHELAITAELLFCDIMLDSDQDMIKEKYQKEEKRISVLKSLPSTQRMFYAYYLLVEEDTEKARESLKAFEKIVKKYPYPSEIAMERELIALIEERK